MFGVYGWTDKSLASKYRDLEQPDDKIMAMYVWIDGSGETMRAKTRTLDYNVQVAEDCPEWNFDGSSTGQAEGKNSDVFLMPVAVFQDPFRGGNNKLVLCETFDHERMPHKSNKRRTCTEVMRRAKIAGPEFSIEQEYTLLGVDQHPFGWPKNGFPGPEGPYYCGVGANKVYGRDIVEAHYRLCLIAGINISATNSEVMPSQWSFAIGPCEGIELADHLWMARFILHRTAEEFGVVATLDPKPVLGEWHAAGAICNFSTNAMRRENGINAIEEAIDKLMLKHSRHISLYDPKGGEDNKRRMSTRSLSTGRFRSGGSSTNVMIPTHVQEAGRGYLVDRRPSSNSDPYMVTEILVRTIVFDE